MDSVNELNTTKRSETGTACGDFAIREVNYWCSLINEKAAAVFLNLQPRTLQAYRQRGGGPRYVAISARCVRYRRTDLRSWADGRLRTTTTAGRR